ncbi:MAG: hypothetical protein JWQ57_3219 [Mucilaginibacter sp.]|nr:hypothetical protein [Mucilaginibacter sp.]
MVLALIFKNVKAQNYLAAADSCFKIRNYACAAINYDLYLDKLDPESNGYAYRAAVSWALAGDKEKTFIAINRYIKNNALNKWYFFSDQLIKEKSFDSLKDDVRWTAMISSVQIEEARIREQERKELETAKIKCRSFETALDVRPQLTNLKMSGDIYPIFKKLLIYKSPKAYLTDNGIALFIKINNKDIPFYLQLPDGYNPQVANPALVVLHGAVKYTKEWSGPALSTLYRATSPHIPNYSKNYIAIYPMGSSNLNWMNTEKGFDMVNEIVTYLKAYLNIDDNRVELLGHSNGATGVFTYLVKSPSLYAGFYGMNTQPKVYIGGTFLQNGMSRHFYNFATDKDYYYPFAAVKKIDSLANSLSVNWHTQINYGYPHWFPSMKESLVPMANIFEDMATRVRNPYPDKIYFETDNIKYGVSDWISITGLDTISKKAVWQIDPNFKITEWLDNRDFNKTIYREELAFDYPHKSGAIKARRKGNNIYIETSDVASFAVRLNREMIDYGKKVNVYLNGKKIYSKKISHDKQYTLANFKLQLDRKAIWENEIGFEVK